MEKSKACPGANLVIATVLCYAVFAVNGQISTPCTSSMISSFTPCINFITGSSSNGSRPTGNCCDSLKSLVSSNMDCACLMLTGGVPLSLPFNRNSAISLPQLCNGGIPIQCKASGVPLPPPGPTLFGPSPAPDASAPSSPTPRGSKATTIAPPPDETTPGVTPAPSSVAPLAPTAHPGIKPVVNPKSASTPSCVLSPLLLLLVLGTMVFY